MIFTGAIVRLLRIAIKKESLVFVRSLPVIKKTGLDRLPPTHHSIFLLN